MADDYRTDALIEAFSVALNDLKQVQTAMVDLITMLYKNGTITLDQSRDLAKTIFGDRIELKGGGGND